MSITFEVCSRVKDFEAALVLDTQTLTDAKLKPKSRESREALFEKGNLLLIKDGNTVVGFDFFDIRDKTVIVNTIGILPEYRRRGVGDKFMPYIGSVYREKGATLSQFYLRADDPDSAKFYKRWKCQRIGQEVIDGVAFDVFLYHLIGPVRVKPIEEE